MKYLSKITLIILIFYTFEAKNILIKNIINIKCDGQGSTTFGIEASSSEYLNEVVFFQLEIDGHEASCSIPINYPIDSTFPETTTPSYNWTEPDSVYSDESSTPEDPSSDNRRILSEDIILKGGICVLENIENKIENKKVNSISKDIFVNDLHVDLDKCPKKEVDTTVLSISFRQLNKFFYDSINQLITFYFYGLITGKLQKGYQITMTVYLIKNGFLEEKQKKTAICSLTEDINGEKPVQGNFYCSILNIKEQVTSFEYSSSSSIAGIPSDKVLLNPVLTEKSISKGDLTDYSTGNSTIDIVPSFNITSIESTNCKVTGEFTIIGNLSSELKYDIQFELPFSSPKITATCIIKKSKELINVEMNCKTKGNIPNQQVKIAQTSLLDNKKKELLLIEKYNNNLDKIVCVNSKLQIVEYPITFRQVNKFRKLNNNKFSFLFAGLSQKNLYKGVTIKILVVFVKEIGGKIEKRNQKDITCTLNSDVTPFNGGFAQADFYCEDNLEDDADSIEIISSNNVTGINDEIKDYEKNPKLTEEEIEKTKNTGGIGKIIDYTLQANKLDIIPIIQIISLSKNKCVDKGILKFKAKFSEDINQKLDFEIPLSYPSSSIKCSSPKAKANKEIFIDCKIQKEFYGIKEIFIEPTIIKKLNKEILFASKTNLTDIGIINCIDYNQKLLQDLKRKNETYTFVQTNNFKIINKRILFNLIIFQLKKKYEQTIKIIIIITKRISSLRNLEEIDEIEEEITCKKEQADELVNYICEGDNNNINNKTEIENFIIESDEMTGLSDINTNPIETDENIGKGLVRDFSDPELIKLKMPRLDGTDLKVNDNNECEDGVFTIDGTLKDKEVYEKGENAELNYLYPSGSGAICNFKETKINNPLHMECHNKDYFEYENLIIDTQMIGRHFILDRTESKGEITCSISPYSFKEAQSEEASEGDVKNSYYKTKSSSSGLSGAIISAIVIICFVILVLIGIIIALIKKRVIPPSNQTNYNTSIIPISTSSASIV